MCTLLQLEKNAEIARDMYPTMAVSVSPLYRHDMKLRCLLNGRQEFNPIDNRRHAWDAMLHYNLYIKKLDSGFWECGVHGSDDSTVEENPLSVIVTVAFKIATMNSNET